jgi:heavy metal sensor kinase
MPLSLRWRLTLWNTLALMVGLLGFAVLVYLLLANALSQRLDRELMTEFRELRQEVVKSGAGPENLRKLIHDIKDNENLLCVIYDPAGQVIARTDSLPRAAIPPRQPGLLMEAHLESATIGNLGRFRTLEASYREAGQQFTAVLMMPLEEVDRQLTYLLKVLTIAVPMTAILFAGLGYFLARKSLMPMEQVRRLTDEITADRLDRRLPVENPSDELGRLAQTINGVIARLEKSFAEVRRFTADASHELRTPLTAIRTEAEVALDKSLSPADYQHLLGSILEECDRLTRLTDQLLSLAREDAGVRTTREALDLTKLVHQVTETMHPLAEAKGVNLEAFTNGPVSIQGDEGRLRQVFYNLIDNAIKYTPEGGRVRLSLETLDSKAVVTLHDTGIGISSEHLPLVFDRFYRVDKARSRSEGGTGLGLSIAQTIVHAHGGRIELASKPSQGTTCTVTLPSNGNLGPSPSV